MKSAFLLVLALTFAVSAAHAQVGALIWEDDFDNLDNWIKVTGNGSWGWGNGELEYYKEENVTVAGVPGEPGNNAMVITAKQESGPGITDQWGNPLNYTSGKVYSKSKVTVKYGMIETRMMVPDIDLAGWPAFWLLGTANYGWPRSGEIDMMEMGGHKSGRDLHDTHNGGNGLDNSTVNQMVGANAIYYSDAAINPGNPSGAASLSWDPTDVYARPYYNYDGLVGRFMTYRLYWDDATLRMTVFDDGVEHDLFETPFEMDAESDEFNEPFYLITNLAIGGAFTDAYVLGDPGAGLPVSMPFPAEMLVDYVKVYEWNGQGEVHLGPPAFESASYGIYTDETPTNGGLVAQETSEIYVWEGTLVDGPAVPPFEGDNVLSWQTAGIGWFGAGVMSIQPLNLFDFGDGHLKFRIKIPSYVTFEIGIIDAWGNQNYVVFPANQTRYGLVRDGEWGQAAIPVSDIRGLAMDLRMLSYSFVILERNGAACSFALDDIYWDAGVVAGVGETAPVNRVKLGANVPNPFNAMTEIRFELPSSGLFDLVIYDVAGHRVKGFQGVGDSGANTIHWDGRDDAGAMSSSGVYYYHLKTAEGEASRKMVMVK